jgi:hypothetical protein
VPDGLRLAGALAEPWCYQRGGGLAMMWLRLRGSEPGWLDLAYTSRVPRVYLPAVPDSGHHGSRAVTMSAAAGRKRNGRPLSVRGTGMWVRMRARLGSVLRCRGCPALAARSGRPAGAGEVLQGLASGEEPCWDDGADARDALDAVVRISGQPGPLWVRS